MKTTQTNINETRLREMMANAFPAAEPSEELNWHVQALAAQPVPTSQRRTKFALALTWCAIMSALTAAVFILSSPPRQVDAMTLLGRVEKAMGKVHAAHMVEWYTGSQEGVRHVEVQYWYQDGRWRREGYDPGAHQVAFVQDGSYWQYTESDNSVYIGSKSETGWDDFLPSGFKLSDTKNQLQRDGNDVSVIKLADTIVNGRPVHHLVVDTNDGEQKRHANYWVDSETNLVVRSVDVGNHFDYTYNQPMPAPFFVPAFPKTAKVTDHRLKPSSLGLPQQKTATILGVYWRGSATYEGVFPDQSLGKLKVPAEYVPDLIVTFARMNPHQSYHQLDGFWEHASPYFVLHAAGHPDVRMRLIGLTSHGKVEAWGGKFSPIERDKMVPGVRYSIEPLNIGDYTWTVATGVDLVRPSVLETAPITTPPDRPTGVPATLTIDGVYWAGCPGFQDLFRQGLFRTTPKSEIGDMMVCVEKSSPDLDYAQLMAFKKGAPRTFLLRAAGHPDLHLTLDRVVFQTDDLQGYSAVFAPGDRNRAIVGATYQIVPVESSRGYLWIVKPNVTLGNLDGRHTADQVDNFGDV